MNKEEIKVALYDECKKCYFPRRKCYTCVKDSRKKIRKYIKELEQKESILNKVIKRIKEDIENDYCIKEYTTSEYGVTGVIRYPIKSYGQEILNFMEGEK